MKIANYSLIWYPKSENVEIIRPKKPNAVVETYDSVAYFSWTPILAGQKLSFEWDNMSVEQFDALDVLYQADNQVVLDLLGDGTKQYNVMITDLNGTYFFIYEDNFVHRRNIKMELLVMSEVV